MLSGETRSSGFKEKENIVGIAIKILLCMGLLAGFGLGAANAANALPYDEQADSHADIRHALAKAKTGQKNVLLVFGANWCPDCRALSEQMAQGSLAREVRKRYVVVKVNIGNWDHNMDIASEYGNPPKKGIPAIAVLDSQGRLLNATMAGELSVARSMNNDSVLKVFEKINKPQ